MKHKNFLIFVALLITFFVFWKIIKFAFGILFIILGVILVLKGSKSNNTIGKYMHITGWIILVFTVVIPLYTFLGA